MRGKGFTLLRSIKVNSSGFTLVELLVVIAIIAILSVIGVTVFSGVQKNARDSARKADIQTINKAFETHYVPGSGYDYNSLPSSYFASGVIPTPPERGSYFIASAVDGSGVKICARLENFPNPACNSPSPTCYCESTVQSIPNPNVNYNFFNSTGAVDNTSNNPSYMIGFGGSGSQSPSSCDSYGTLDDGLVGYWKMNEGLEATTVADSSGHGGTLQFRPDRPARLVSTGKEGNALMMYEGADRTDSGAYVDQRNAAALNISGTQISFGGWIYLTAMPQSGSYGTFLQKNSIGYRLLIYPDGTSLVHINSKQVPEWGRGNTIGKDKWYFLFVTYDGKNIKFYLDGDLRRTDPYDQLIASSSSFNLGIGRGEYPAISGYIDEARVYNRALFLSEVTALYNNGAGCFSP